MIHNLKIKTQFYKDYINNLKTFEIRKEEGRTFSIGDILILNEIDENENFTGNVLEKKVIYISRYFQNHVVMGVK